MQLSPHFSLAELTLSQTASRMGLDNAPPRAIFDALKDTAAKMEAIRTLLGVPIVVTSGYRSPQVNRAVGGAHDSAHCKGFAIDFIAPAFGTPFQVAKAIKDADPLIEFDQLIYECGQWCHISFDPLNRRQIMTFQDGEYTNGLRP